MNVPFAALISSIGCCTAGHAGSMSRSHSGADGHVRASPDTALMDIIRADLQRGVIALERSDRASAMSAFDCATVTHRHRLLVWRVLAQLRPTLEFAVIADELTANFVYGYLTVTKLDTRQSWMGLRLSIARIIKEL